MTRLCPWTGQACNCNRQDFPWKGADGAIPPECEKIIANEMIELAAVRSVTDKTKLKYQQYIADVKAGKYRSS